MPDTPSLTVLLFARYAELFGAAELRLALPQPATVAGVVEALRILPGGAALPLNPLVAVNARQARSDQPVSAGDELALLPPMAGG
ncbi:MAG: MoaD/ThiS family protein [Gemmatimonadota bacterium]|nr:MoaD/ThiS family protein [Gemmatimonadota bacterium]